MKRKSILAGLIAVSLHTTITAQMVINVVNTDEVLKAKAIDDLLFTVQYHTTFLHDIVKPESREDETMMLKVGKKLSQYYSYTKYLTDSVIEIDKANGASKEVIIEHLQQYSPKVVAQVYKNFPDGKVTTLDRLIMTNLICEEKNERPEWEILSDTMTVASYPCHKATGTFKGRTYEVWFTTEIPRSEGPWKLNGLPGLILKAKDTEGHYTFECTGLIQNHTGEKIMFPGADYEPVTRKHLAKMYERYVADPAGFIKVTAPNLTMRFQDEDGQETRGPRNIPYNPIELTVK